MNYGFLIRNDRCIGCHACSTACKSENEVPLGVQRTWVKSVETGAYPNVTRHFQVTRCNHCANPPCVRICPVTAMYQRDDGIVEFDPDVCIGCKACMQACPYDAIYVDPESGTAAKCHYCAHRVELNMEPACVVVCPEHAIIAGDLDDPLSEISRMIAENQVTVRKPEQGTIPKLYYVDGEEANLSPGASPPQNTFAWTNVVSSHSGDGGSVDSVQMTSSSKFEPSKKSASGATLRAPQPQGSGGPIHIGQGRMAEQMVQVAYNAQHQIPWHWPVPAYLVTKGLAAGLFLILAAGYLFDWMPFDAGLYVVGGLVSLVFMAVTTGLLIFDLERPERFLRILLRPQWKSWLVKGAYLLVGFSALLTVWWVSEAGAYWGFWHGQSLLVTRALFLGVGMPLALGAAVYTAYLFGQAEGRDLWQNPLLPVHMMIQSILAGAAGLLIVVLFFDVSEGVYPLIKTVFVTAIGVDLIVMLMGEFGMSHATESAAQAARKIYSGRYKRHFWGGSIALGHLLSFGLIVYDVPLLSAIAGLTVLIGLYLYEYAFIMAPQEVPNS